MKHNITKSLLALAITLLVLPMQSQDYLKIYFKDGHTERHFMHLVESISATKYDLEGNLHSDYQMQQIVMKDATLSYYLADIDSMSFKKVDEEQLKKEVDNTLSSVQKILDQNSSEGLFNSHLDEIKSLEGVEDVIQEGSAAMIQIKDWYPLYITFQPILESDGSIEEWDNALKGVAKTRQATGNYNSYPLKVALGFQMADDNEFSERFSQIKYLKDKFSKMGFEADFLTGESLGLDFFGRRLFDYDLVFVSTHGLYIRGKHGLFTGVKLPGWSGWYLPGAVNQLLFMDLDEVSVGATNIQKKNEGQSGGWTCYMMISEDYIKKYGKGFTDSGPHVVFIGACENLKGSFSLANIFFDKGADVYYGYNDVTHYTNQAAYSYFSNILNGMSLEAAYDDLPSFLKKEETDERAELIEIFNSNPIYDNPKGFFAYKTQTIDKTDQEASDEYKKDNSLNLQGKTTVCQYDYAEIKYGFRLGTSPGVDELSDDHNIEADWNHLSDNEEVTFSAVVDLEPGQTYYYRAYTYDGIHYNWGNEESFKIEKQEINPDAYLTCPDNHHPHAIDLGLPSGTLWACCDVGASKPEKLGLYYKWGEIEGTEEIIWETFPPYAYGTFEYIDGETCFVWTKDIGDNIAGTQYDVAHMKWGNGWHMPTNKQIDELNIRNITYEVVTINGENVLKVKSKINDGVIFLPCGRFVYNDEDEFFQIFWGAERRDYEMAEALSFCDDVWHGLSFDHGACPVTIWCQVRPVKEP